MAIAASLANAVISSDPASVVNTEPTALIAAALKYNKLSIDEGFTAFDQVNRRSFWKYVLDYYMILICWPDPMSKYGKFFCAG
jgi:hypothetical protein